MVIQIEQTASFIEKEELIWLDPVNSDAQFLNCLADGIVRNGVHLVICSRKRYLYGYPQGAEWVDFGGRAPVKVSLEKGIKRYVTAGTYFYDWWRTVKRILQRKPSKILFTSSLKLQYIDAYFLSYLKRYGIKVNYICHKPHANYYISHGDAQAARYKKIYSLFDKILVMTNYTRNLIASYYGIDQEKLYLFDHPHYSEFLKNYKEDVELKKKGINWKKDTPVIGVISNYSKEHGFDTFFKSLAIMHAKNVRSKILIITHGGKNEVSLREKIIKKLNEVGVNKDDSFVWADRYDYPVLISMIKLCDVIVLPYEWATQSGVVPMANCFGIPVIVSNVGGLSEMVVSGVSGELVNSALPEDFAHAYKKILEKNNLSRYKRGALKMAEEMFDPIKSGKQVVDIVHA